MPREFSPFVTPDSMRKTLNLLKNFYDSHTKKNYGYEDICGTQYSGVVENFGSELYIESRKLLMNNPSLENVFVHNTFDFYFDIQFSKCINTYDQQLMLVALLSKDVFISNNYSYHIRFDNVYEQRVLRSESWSDPDVYIDRFYTTTTPPTLIKHNNITNIDEEISLIIDDGTDVDTIYSFYYNKATVDFIDNYDEENKILTTAMLNDNMSNLPFVWICVNSLRILPDIGFINNSDMNGNDLLVVGTDGNGVSKIYPLIYGENNLPEYEQMEDGTWFIKLIPSDQDQFVYSSTSQLNSQVNIKQIKFIYSSDIKVTPYVEHTIEFDNSYVDIKITNLNDWVPSKPKEGDYDYDGTTYVNKVYLYASLSMFNRNIPNESFSNKLKAMLDVRFDDGYLHEYEDTSLNAVSGIHIDVSSDYSDNSINKKNGVIHSLGDFDGLPSYFKYMLDRTIHRAHVEMYSIRDRLNNSNTKAVNKQTAAIIIDSSIPQTELKEADTSLNIVIMYDVGRELFYTKGESVLPGNNLSELTYHNDYEFGCLNNGEVGEEYRKKWVYHGNNLFSLGIAGLNPLTEYGRGYCISNDDCVYENNLTTTHKKPARTLARICDIPTSYMSLISVTNFAPPIIIDELYTRQIAFLSEHDKEMIWHDKTPKLVTPGGHGIIFDYTTDLSKIDLLDYKRQLNLISTFDLSKISHPVGYEVSPINGSGYQIGDEFKFNIGGVFFDGMVTEITNRVVSKVSIQDNDDAKYMNISNLGSATSVFNVDSTSINGTGLQIMITIPTNTWELLQQKNSIKTIDGLIAFKYDDVGNVWLYYHDGNLFNDENRVQLTGEDVIYNYYDLDINPIPRSKRKTNHVMLYNDMTLFKQYMTNSNGSGKRVMNTDISVSSYNNAKQTDLSSSLNIYNHQESICMLTEYTGEDPSVDITTMKLNQFTRVSKFNTYQFNGLPYKTYNEYTLPGLNQLNLSKYNNIICSLICRQDNDNMTSQIDFMNQPTLMMFDPYIDKVNKTNKVGKDNIEITSIRDLTFIDYFDESSLSSYLTKDGHDYKLNHNVYTYNEKSYNEEYDKIKTKIESFTNKSSLLNFINELFGKDNEVNLFENTTNEFDLEHMKQYAIARYLPLSAYKKNDMYLLRTVEEKVVGELNGNKYSPIGEQPTGDYVDISSNTLDNKIYIDRTSSVRDILYVFKIEDTNFNITKSDYRLYDEENNDISNNSLIIIGKLKYICQNDIWTRII